MVGEVGGVGGVPAGGGLVWDQDGGGWEVGERRYYSFVPSSLGERGAGEWVDIVVVGLGNVVDVFFTVASRHSASTILYLSSG